MKVNSFTFTLIPGFMVGLEIPDVEEGEFAFLLDLGIFRLIFERFPLK